jgi:hypothetical protein
VPLAQVIPLPQAFPQAPQWSGSSSRLVEHPASADGSQSAKPALQVVVQEPFEQDAVAFSAMGQIVWQPPQFCGSVSMFVMQPSFRFGLQSA